MDSNVYAAGSYRVSACVYKRVHNSTMMLHFEIMCAPGFGISVQVGYGQSVTISGVRL